MRVKYDPIYRVNEILPIFRMGRDVLGYKQSSKYDVGLEGFHCGWLYQMLTNRKTLLEAARGHFKTTVRTIVYPIWKLVNNRNLTCLITNESYDKAKSFLREISGHLRDNKLFIKTFGNYYKGHKIWQAERIEVNRSLTAKEPTFAVGSTQGTIVSPHVDLLIGDDLISDKNSWFPIVREAVVRWWKKSLIPVADKKNAEHHVHGTPWHYQDLYEEIKKLKGWNILINGAEDGELKNILFPKRFPKEKLEELKDNMGDIFYNCQYLCDPTGLEGATFDVGWLEYYEDLPQKVLNYLGIDLAIGEARGADYFVVFHVGIDEEKNIYLINFWRRQGLKVPEQLDVLNEVAGSEEFSLIGVESGGYQAAFAQIATVLPETKQLPIVEIKSNIPKYRRLLSLSSLFQRGVIKLNKHLAEDKRQLFLREYLRFSPQMKGTDDILDSMEIAIRTSQMWAVPTVEEEVVEPTEDGTFRIG